MSGSASELRALVADEAVVLADALQLVEKQPPAPSARLLPAFEHAPLAMALVGPDDRLIDGNPALCRLAGRSRDELAALTIAELTHPEDRDAADSARRLVVAGTVAASSGEVRLVRPDGRTARVSISCFSADDDGAPCLVVQFVDVTEQRQTEMELRRSNAELSSFAYLAAHELKSPLQTLSGFAALLERVHGPDLDVQAREFVGWIAEGATRMDCLIEDLLAHCLVDTDDTVHSPVALGEVVAEALSQLEREVTRRGATVSIDDLPVVTGDPIQMGQLLQNLLANALKFVADGQPPQIHVSAERSAAGWTVTVADNGIGVDDASRERIFTMFERLHPRELFKGTGIGLSICKRIVERRGGAIWMEPNPAGGSRFRFRVPDTLSSVSFAPAVLPYGSKR